MGDEVTDTTAASAPTPGGSAPADDTDAIINEIAAEAQAARLKDLDARQAAKPAPPETKLEPAEASDDDDDDDDAEPEPAKPAAKKAATEADGDFADVDSLSADDRLEKAQAALKAGDLKKALRLALKTNPEALKVDAGKFAAFRQAQRREQQKLAARAAERDAEFAQRDQSLTERDTQLTQRDQAARAEINQWIERLKPLEPFYQAAQAFENDGDPKHLVKIIEGLTGKPYNDAQAIILRSEKQDPRLSRMQAEMERQRAEHQRLLQQLEQSRQAEEQRRQQEEQARQQQTAAQGRANDLAYIKKELKGHEVAKLPRFDERVYKVLEKHFDPKLKSPTITVEQAAQRVLRAERKRVESSPFYVKPTPAAAPETPAPKVRSTAPALRRDSQNNGANLEPEDTESIIRDIAAQAQRARMAAGK